MNPVSFPSQIPRTIKDTSYDLHKLLDETEISMIKTIFEQEDDKRINKEQLREVLWRIASIEYDDDKQFDKIFEKMNHTCNGFVTWDEFISYLILGFEQQEISVDYKTLDPPIPVSPTIVKSNHRYNINRITFYPTVKPDRSSTWNDGSIVTCSHDGTINYWSLDMKIERTAKSTCPYLKVQKTSVTDMAVLPDVSVICTSSSERDLRFYDTSARKFRLRVMIVSIPFAITAMYYIFDKNLSVPSKLICGDTSGSVKVIFIDSEARGPFKSQSGISLQEARYHQALNGVIPNMRITEINNIHSDFIRQVSYYSSLHSVVTCAQCFKGLQITDITDQNKFYVFKIIGGVWSFTVSESNHLVATGGPDRLVRVWNPFVQGRPICTFYGHRTGIVQMQFQDSGSRLYSLSKDKCIKIWDVASQEILQTYLELPSTLGNDLTSLYNPESRQWIIASVLIATVPLSPKESSEHTDGNTHTSGVSVVLFNRLYQIIVTCGLDSYIIVWNPWDGRRLLLIKDAHTVMLHGGIMPVEITAATFDPGYQRLLTGAHDGTLKIWNFNTGTCLRNMKIDQWYEIQSVIWVKGRIMAIGWNRRITEFADTYTFSKNWDLQHSEDVSCAVVRIPEAIATSSYNGELILWRLVTGQPYKKFNVSKPNVRIKIDYQLVKVKDKFQDDTPSRKVTSIPQKIRTSIIPRLSMDSPLSGPVKHTVRKLRDRRVSTIIVPDEMIHLKKLAVHTMLFLNARKTDPKIGTLLVALENGNIQVWSHHITGGYITQFSAIHKAGDYVISMTTDEENHFLFTGTTVGYIKIWLLRNYCVLEEEKEHICMPMYRLRFPFMWGDRFVGRARRMQRNQPFPILLSSFKGHSMPVSGILYIDKCELIVSCSADFSSRMWTLGGRYLQTIGTFKPWKPLSSEEPVETDFEFDIPPDIKKVASSTTLRVLCGGSFPKRLTIKQLKKLQEKDHVDIDANKIYGKALEEPILGHYFNISERTVKPRKIEFDTSFSYIPVFQHLITPPPVPIEREKVGIDLPQEETK
ncbi:WD repeat-containing protein on Y chromosome [Diorhabda sublineata]|uniref:WD repeat-containing protein on Y chromosome n=1 Tax=Diorhabda sublineata TaxID=1163346 RepID=UPI0024E14D1C|nr:WD repeat-containing protein on Y chromosome [Diorhabda sublineata]